MNLIDFSKYKDTDLVEVYSVFNDEGFTLGYILKEMGEYILFETISLSGALDKYELRKKDNIEEIVSNSSYIDMYKYYIKYNRNLNIFDVYGLTENRFEFETLDDLIMYCLKSNKNITLVTSSEDYILTGKLVLAGKDSITMLLNDSKEPSKITIHKEDIVVFEFLSVENYLFSKFEISRF